MGMGTTSTPSRPDQLTLQVLGERTLVENYLLNFSKSIWDVSRSQQDVLWSRDTFKRYLLLTVRILILFRRR